MRSSACKGRVYRRCGCRDGERRQLGARCPGLVTDPGHGTWTFAVDLPAPTGSRVTVRRGGFGSDEAAAAALRRLLEGAIGGFDADPNQTVAEYLTEWLQAKSLTLKLTTLVRYRDYVVNDLVSHLGAIRLDELGRRHLVGFARAQLAAGRGRVSVHRCLATLSSALGEAVRQHRLQYNPARPTIVPRPRAAERTVWSAREAVRFLRCCREGDPLLADLCEVLIGTGMRKGEALGLHWADVHLDEGVLYVRYTLSAVDNNRLVIIAPKTRSSRNWVAISPRVAAALRRRARASGSRRVDPADPFTGLVFTRDNGRPLRPQTLLDRFRHWSALAGVPRITMHDLRHLAATLTITAGVPLTVVSKTLRHSTLSTTANIYAHLTRSAAHGAVDAIEEALAAAEGVDVADVARHPLNRLRPHRDHPARLRDLFKPLYTAAVAGRSLVSPKPERRSCDHTATTTPQNAEKAALSFLRRRPPTCVNAGRDDRI